MHAIHLHSLYTIANVDPSLQEFAPSRRFSAKVLQLLPDGKALVRINGIDLELTSAIALKEQQRLVLEVVEHRADQIIFKRIDQKIDKSSTIQKELIRAIYGSRLDLALFTNWQKLQQDIKIKKIFTSLGLDPKGLDGAALKEFYDTLKHVAKLGNLEDGDKLEQFAMLLQLGWLVQSISGGFVSFLPLDWQKLQESGIYIKRIKEKEAYFCRVKLRFADIDRIDFTIILQKRYLSLYLYIEDESFRLKIQESLHKLKERLSGGKVAVTIAVKEYNVVNIESLFSSEHILKRWA